MFFQNPLKRLRSRLLCAIEITRSQCPQSNCLHVIQSDSGNYTRRKNHSRFCYISRSTQKLYCMDFCRVNQNQHVPIMPRRTEKSVFTHVTSSHTNRKCLHKKRVQLPRDLFVHQHGLRSIVLEHQYGCRDVM